MNFRSWDWKKEKRNLVQRIHKLYELKLCTIQQYNSYLNISLASCSTYAHFSVYGPFLCDALKFATFIRQCAFYFFLPQTFDFSLQWGNAETDAGTTKRTFFNWVFMKLTTSFFDYFNYSIFPHLSHILFRSSKMWPCLWKPSSRHFLWFTVFYIKSSFIKM